MDSVYTLLTYDCFYTSEKVAKECWNELKTVLAEKKINSNFDLWLEPSAGNGAFFDLLPQRNRRGIDIRASSNSAIEQGDFLKWPIEDFTSKHKNIITVGNPPFGKNSSLAVKFFNRSAQFSNCIAMVFPRTFLKKSVQNRLDLNFKLIKNLQLREQSFEFNDEPYSVPCVFQVWKRENTKREKLYDPLIHPDFEFTTRDHAEFAIQRVGVAAGKIKEDFHKYADESHYFIKSLSTKVNVKELFLKIKWDSIKHNTAGNPSISKRELVKLYTEKRNRL